MSPVGAISTVGFLAGIMIPLSITFLLLIVRISESSASRDGDKQPTPLFLTLGRDLLAVALGLDLAGVFLFLILTGSTSPRFTIPLVLAASHLYLYVFTVFVGRRIFYATAAGIKPRLLVVQLVVGMAALFTNGISFWFFLGGWAGQL